jgi:hypothetical protein
LRRADPLSRGFLPNVCVRACVHVIECDQVLTFCTYNEYAEIKKEMYIVCRVFEMKTVNVPSLGVFVCIRNVQEINQVMERVRSYVK